MDNATVNYYAHQFVDEAFDLNNVPAEYEDTGESATLNGRYTITDYTGNDNQVGVFYVMPERDYIDFNAAMSDPDFETTEFNFPMYIVTAVDLFESIPDAVWEPISRKNLEKQWTLPAAEHPLGPHTGNNDFAYQIQAARDFMDFIGEEYYAYGDPFSISDEMVVQLINAYYPGGWDQFVADENADGFIAEKQEIDELESAFNAPSVEHPLGPHTGDYRLDPLLEEVLEEQMREGGVPEEEIKPSISDIVESMNDKLQNKDEHKVISMDKNADTGKYEHKFDKYKKNLREKGKKHHHGEIEKESGIERSSIPADHLLAGVTPEELDSHLAADIINEPVPTQGFTSYEESPAEQIVNTLDAFIAGPLEDYRSKAAQAALNGDIESVQSFIRIIIESLQAISGQVDNGIRAASVKTANADIPELEFAYNGQPARAYNIDIVDIDAEYEEPNMVPRPFGPGSVPEGGGVFIEDFNLSIPYIEVEDPNGQVLDAVIGFGSEEMVTESNVTYGGPITEDMIAAVKEVIFNNDDLMDWLADRVESDQDW